MRPYLLDQFQLFVANVASYRFSDRLVNFFDEFLALLYQLLVWAVSQ